MGDESTANQPVPAGPEPTLRSAIGFNFTRMSYYYTNVTQLFPDHSDVKSMRRFSFTLPNNNILDIGSFTLHGNLKMNGSSDARARIPDGMQSFFEQMTIYHNANPLTTILGYNTVVKLKENLHEDFTTLKHRDIMEHLNMYGVDARPERIGYIQREDLPNAASGKRLEVNQQSLQKAVMDPWGASLAAEVSQNNTGRPGPQVTNTGRHMVEDVKNKDWLSYNITFDKDEDPDSMHQNDVDTPHFMINNFRGFLSEIQPRFLPTSLLGNITIEFMLTDDAAVPAYDNSSGDSRDNRTLYDPDGSNATTNNRPKAKGTIMGLPPKTSATYELRNLYATIDNINMADDEFAEAARDLATNFKLEFQYKDYDTEPKKHSGNTNFSHGAISLDNIYAVFRDPDYRSPSPPLRTPDDPTKVVDRFYMSRRNRFLCPNIKHFQWTFNNTKVPQYFSTPMDAYWQLKNGRSVEGSKIQTKLDWLYSMFTLSVRFNFPYAPVRLRSGANTRGMNAQIMLDTTPGSGGYKDIAQDADNQSGELAPLNSNYNGVDWSNADPEMLLIYEKTGTLRVGPSLDAHVDV